MAVITVLRDKETCSQVIPATCGEMKTSSEATKIFLVDSETKSAINKISLKAMIIT
jgi:hypothetical protein